MLSLASVDDKFHIKFEIVENGQGTFSGIIDEIVQNQAPSFVFIAPRRLLRVPAALPLNTAMVVKSQAGTHYMLGEHGFAESFQGTVFNSFRLFPTSSKFGLQRRVKTVELVTGLDEDEQLVTVDNIWGSYEPLQEQFDRETRVAAETARFISNKELKRGDVIDGKRVFRVDRELGLYIATLS